MLAPTGNMLEVYRQTERNRLRKIKRQAVKAITEIDHRTPAREAEITEGSKANWYVIVPMAGQESIAVRHLVRRHFGIYLPMLQKTRIIRGRKVTRKERVFPGYIFAFIFDVDKMYHRVKYCPGVSNFVMTTNGPAIMPDAFINRLQGMETVTEGLLPAPSNKRFRKRYRKIAAQLAAEAGDDKVTLHTLDVLNEINLLEVPERIGLLQRALSLPSQDKNGHKASHSG